MAEPFPLQPSLWHATAPAAPQTPPLAADARADVCIVGAGYAGLSTALHLAEAGVSVVVLEAREPGWGASGRNGGQVIPGIKYDPSEIVSKYGPEAGEALVSFVGSTANLVFGLIEKHGMDVPHRRAGWIQGAHTPAMVETVKRRAEQWSMRGVAARYLDADAASRLLGSDRYLGGWLDPRGGGVQPLAYARGLARAAQRAGVAICGQSLVTGLRRDGGNWVVRTAQGASVTAPRVVIATNGYTGDLIPKLRQTVIRPNSFIVATEPLSDNLAGTILPEGQVTSDTRQLLLYFRKDHTNRLLMGGRGPFREPQSADDWAHLERVVGKMYPQARDLRIDYRWCGRVALTRDFLPHLHEPEPGLLVDIGCMGRGVGLQTAMGRAMAQYLSTGDRASLPFPVTSITPLPLHALNELYVSAIIAWYRLTDGGMKDRAA
ncbi:FAD-binding oxidoreductase [Bosea sp. (in: a-proteobacteria)]|uniref:NAD(P)/FAD-dependent oxidoreductase n=1 Tax=Bosea sp. (in: a-proteobacteria) TaxID=1871050 RepID=UPI0025BF7A30|nr:FAD-binding oxidoreductase [Bosea sp. (in: a-proteobacteria)]MBR3192993.1 FAD-binding oxidoreductase [Bosea sp. (in: a-proteobacteria)]